jgi:hypothetical protein
MSTLWYYAHDEKKLGPFSPGQLKEMAAAGTILPMDTVWMEGVEKGVLASRVKHLFAPAAAKSTQPIDDASPAATIAASPLVEPTSPAVSPPPEIIVNTSLIPLESYAIKAQSKAPEKPPRKGRAFAMKGADIEGQDGVNARYRKKCIECGHKDSASHVILLSNRVHKENFFCPKCRKRRDVEIQCQM